MSAAWKAAILPLNHARSPYTLTNSRRRLNSTNDLLDSALDAPRFFVAPGQGPRHFPLFLMVAQALLPVQSSYSTISPVGSHSFSTTSVSLGTSPC